MALNLKGYEARVAEVVKSFWQIRDRKGVRSGKTLNAFVDLLIWVVHSHGLPDAIVLTGRRAQLPGFFRPSKAWDVLIVNHGTLIAAIELKSIADSFGKNINNRNEEALGSGVDIKEAFEEGAFEGLVRLFAGYLILVEECQETLAEVRIQMKNFRVMEDFIFNPEASNETYIRDENGEFPTVQGVSYMKRFDILCRRLMQKNLYTAASLIKSPRTAIEDGEYGAVTRETSIKAFLAALASHVQTIATIQEE